MLTTNEIDIHCAEIFLHESGVIILQYKPDYDVELKDVKEVEKAFIELSGDGDIYCLMDTSGRFNNYTNEAQKYLSNEAEIVKRNKLKGSAVIIDNLPNRMLAQFFSRFFKPKFPMKIFSNQSEGLDWLRILKNGMQD